MGLTPAWNCDCISDRLAHHSMSQRWISGQTPIDSQWQRALSVTFGEQINHLRRWHKKLTWDLAQLAAERVPHRIRSPRSWVAIPRHGRLRFPRSVEDMFNERPI